MLSGVIGVYYREITVPRTRVWPSIAASKRGHLKYTSFSDEQQRCVSARYEAQAGFTPAVKAPEEAGLIKCNGGRRCLMA